MTPEELQGLPEGLRRELVGVWESSVRATHGFLAESDIAEIREQLAARYLDAVRLTLLRDETGRVAAFMGTAGGRLEMLFVRPDCFRRGLGRRLLEYAVASLGITEVDVNEGNPGAAAFYRRHGFVEFGRSEFDSAGRPFPILHMRCLLPEK